MRIGLISDLHIDINKDYPIVDLTAETAAEQMQGKTHCSCSGSFYAIHALSDAADTAQNLIKWIPPGGEGM